MDLEQISKDRFRKGFVIVLTLIFAVLFFTMIKHFFIPVVLALVFSGISRPLYTWLKNKVGGRETMAAFITLTITSLAVLVPVIFLLGMVAEQAIEVSDAVAPWIQHKLHEPVIPDAQLPDWFPFRDDLAPYAAEIRAKVAHFTAKTGTYLAGSLGKLSAGTAGFFFDIFVLLFSMFYFLKHGQETMDTILGYMPLSTADRKKMVDVGLSVSRATIKGTLVIGIVQGALGGLGFAVAGIPAAVFWAAIMAVLSIIPGLGATIVWLPGVVYLLMTGHLVAGVALLAWCAGVVSSVDNVLRPMLVGRDTQMPQILILLSTLGGLTMFGPSGLILGPMLAALFMTVLTIYSRVFSDWLNPDDLPD